MDIIFKLPMTKDGYDAITIWVGRLNRRVHFLKTKIFEEAVDSANFFFSNIFELRGLPENIVSSRNPKFTSAFWEKLMQLCDTQLKMS